MVKKKRGIGESCLRANGLFEGKTLGNQTLCTSTHPVDTNLKFGNVHITANSGAFMYMS